MFENRYFAGLIDLLVGGWMGYAVIHGVVTGRIGIRNGVLDRDENPLAFHFVGLLYAALSIWFLFGGIVILSGAHITK